MIKHISFDLWLTLIKSHPEFKEKRAIFLKNEFNPNSYSVKDIMQIVQSIDKTCDKLNELNGNKIQTELMYKKILVELGNKIEVLTFDLLFKLKLEVNKLFMNFQPIFLNTSIPEILHFLNAEGYSLNISSNTGFIEGDVLIDTLQNLEIYEYFDFCIFSDKINASKPSGNFFKHVFEKSEKEKQEILHIGDNYKADYQGALKYGFKALHLANQQYTINDITKNL